MIERPRKYCNLVETVGVVTDILDTAPLDVTKLLVVDDIVFNRGNFPKNFVVATVIPILRRNFKFFLPELSVSSNKFDCY